MTVMKSNCFCRFHTISPDAGEDVEYCALHAAAPKLLAAAKKGLAALRSATDQFRNKTTFEQEALAMLREAIDAAEQEAKS